MPLGNLLTIGDKFNSINPNKFKPKIAIPMRYHISGSKVDIDTIDEFLSLSSYPYEYMEELEINGKIENKTKIIQLKADVL